MMNWDDAYANMAHVPGSEHLPAIWRAEAEAYRAACSRIDEDLGYGPGARQRLDIVWPDDAPRGLAVFIHGGYWMKFSKADWTQFAEGARARGWAVAVVSYTLAPEARISDITREIAQAIGFAASRVAGPIRLAGHSAGGHLVTRMVCRDGLLTGAVRARLGPVLSISGVHDLRPLLKTKLNEVLRLDLEEARRESPALLEPIDGIEVTAWVGAEERPEFVRQAVLLASVWQGFDVTAKPFVDQGHQHFSVIEGLKDPASAICRAFVGD